MDTALIGLVLEGMLAVLLAVAVYYCIRLDRRLSALRSGQDGFKGAVEALDAATERARSVLADLKNTGLTANDRMAGERKRAEELLLELRLMAESADRVAEKLSAAGSLAPRASQAQPMTGGHGRSGAADAPLIEALRQAR